MRRYGRLCVLAVLVAMIGIMPPLGLAGVPGTAFAQPPTPPPPPNPTNGDLQQSKATVAQRAAAVASLTSRLAGLDAKVDDLHLQLTAQQEVANQALVDMQSAQAAADAASRKAADARIATAAAGSAIDNARAQLDAFLVAQFQNGPDTGPLGLLTSATGPQDLIDRAGLANVVAAQQQQALDSMERARVAKANADSLARAAEDDARAEADRATRAKTAADGAVATVQAQTRAQIAQLQQVQAQRDDVNRQLGAAEAADAGLRDQRARFLTWQQQQAEAEAARQRAAAAAAAARVAQAAPSGGPARAPVRASGSVATVIDRAMSQLGVQYAWGGGTRSGPSRGIRDGGVADSYGDYNRIGFDCSGLMIYAFGGVGISLPHYSGYQYTSGQQVPVSQRRPGDMLFYAEGGAIGHVALYIGDGRMIEAPYSGSAVRVVPMRYGGLMPYVTRML
ncbi:MAG: C40 family peptidase [Pseudonocardia sp.]|nr:C40 family peptidase [Pseudonocardia sp.]